MADERFRALSTDPRYRLPNRKKSQTAVDPRFKRLFTDDGFRNKASVDRYGRKLKSGTAKRDIDSRFRLEKESEEEAGSDVDIQEEEDLLEDGKVRDPAREGFSGSSEEEESTSEEEEDEVEEAEAGLAEDTAGFEQTEGVPMGEVSCRLAVVNLDWDNIRATDIMAVAQSFVPTGGRITRTTVYPSEFGRERMEKEELEGPPRDIFASTKTMDEAEGEDSSEDEDDRIKRQLLQDQAKDGEEFDTAKLRQYQLDRLRYYYAVVECDSDTTAKALYDNMDGREYLTSANFFDLRFIPDDTTFDEDSRDECDRVPDAYKPNDFRTEALTHSKVRLTWDDDDTTRKEVQKRAFSRAEMDENDLRAYIGSDSSDADSVTSRKSAAEDRKAKKREAAKLKMRAALGLPQESTRAAKRDKDEPVGDMQITFSTGLTGKDKSSGVFENEPQDEESTRDRYIRKERDRRQKRKEKMKIGKHDADDEDQQELVEHGDDPFDDPFFNDPKAAATAEKQARKAKRKQAEEAKAAEKRVMDGRRAELELLMADEDGTGVQHFDMKDIEKAEKASRKKKGKKRDKEATVQDDFQIKTDDPRFNQLYKSHEYAIDPTNPRFKGTKGMTALLEEGRKKRSRLDEEDDDPKHAKKSKSGRDRNGDGDLHGLVARLKARK